MTPPVRPPHEGLNAAVAAELRAELARQRLTVQELAAASGVSYGTLRRYLNAERHIDVEVLYALATALRESPTSLVRAAQDRIEGQSLSDETPTLRAVADDSEIEESGENDT